MHVTVELLNFANSEQVNEINRVSEKEMARGNVKDREWNRKSPYISIQAYFVDFLAMAFTYS